MKHLIASTVAVLTVVVAALPCHSQVMQRQVTPDQALFLTEIGAMASMNDDETITIERVFQQAAQNKDVDVKQGDVIVMMNGKKVREIVDLRELYEGVEVGGEVKLGIRRGEERFLVGFEKSEKGAQMSSGGGMRIMIAGDGDAGEVELAHEGGAILSDRDGEIRVMAVLPGGGDLEQDDVITVVNGQQVASLADYREIYGALAIGDGLNVTVRRGDGDVEVELTKAERPAGMMMMGH